MHKLYSLQPVFCSAKTTSLARNGPRKWTGNCRSFVELVDLESTQRDIMLQGSKSVPFVKVHGFKNGHPLITCCIPQKSLKVVSPWFWCPSKIKNSNWAIFARAPFVHSNTVRLCCPISADRFRTHARTIFFWTHGLCACFVLQRSLWTPSK